MAAEHISSSHLEAIASVGKDCQKLETGKDRKSLADIDFRFRNILYEAADNPVLKDISELLYQITFRIWYLTMDRGDWSAEARSMVNEITETMQALEKHTPEATGEIRHEQLLSHIKRIQAKYFGNRPNSVD